MPMVSVRPALRGTAKAPGRGPTQLPEVEDVEGVLGDRQAGRLGATRATDEQPGCHDCDLAADERVGTGDGVLDERLGPALEMVGTSCPRRRSRPARMSSSPCWSRCHRCSSGGAEHACGVAKVADDGLARRLGLSRGEGAAPRKLLIVGTTARQVESAEVGDVDRNDEVPLRGGRVDKLRMTAGGGGRHQRDGRETEPATSVAPPRRSATDRLRGYLVLRSDLVN